MIVSDFAVRTLTPHVGAGIEGLDLSQALDDKAVARLRAAFDEHVALVFRGQTLTDDDQLRFAS